MSKKFLSINDKLLMVENSLIIGPNVDLQDKTVTPTTETQIVTPDEGYYGLSSVIVESGVDTSNVTATESDVLAPKVFVDSEGVEKVGAILTQEAQIIVPSTTDIILSSGLYLGGSQTIKGDSNLIADNIKKGVSIFNVTGNYEEQAFAFITVTYPAGSTLTCTNDTKTLTAKNTSGQWVFAIPEPKTLPETWTVTATDLADSTKTKSETVEITAPGQFEYIRLMHDLYLIDREFQTLDQVVAEWWLSKEYADINETEDYFIFHVSNNTATSRQFYYMNGIDLTDYTTLEVYGHSAAVRDSNKIGIIASTSSLSTFTASVAFGDEETAYSLDISNYNGVYYPAIQGYRGDHYIKYMRLIKEW